jgi:hypothetical protein
VDTIQVNWLARSHPSNGSYADVRLALPFQKLLVILGVRNERQVWGLEERLVDRPISTRAALPGPQGEYDPLHADGPSALA